MVERAWHCCTGGRAASPSPRRLHNAAGRFLVRTSWLAVGAALAGCSLSFPVQGVGVDGSTTGSIDRTAAMLPSSLDVEDLRRAKSAMAVALDPQGDGARVGWQNPRTGSRGAFASARPPYPDHDRVCRAFTGVVATAKSPERSISGAACRDADGSWLVEGSA